MFDHWMCYVCVHTVLYVSSDNSGNKSLSGNTKKRQMLTKQTECNQ